MVVSSSVSSGLRRVVAGTAVGLALASLGVWPAMAKELVFGMLPKYVSGPYFQAANTGAQEAAKELGVTIDFNGPVDANVAKQSDIIDGWIRRKVDAVMVSANDPNALAPAMKRAQSRGIKTMTWDADVNPDARQVFLNQATYEGIGKAMVDMAVDAAGTSKGDFLIVTAVLTAPNQNRWIEEMKKYAAGKYPDMKFPAVLPGDEDLEKSKNVTVNYLRANPETKGVIGVTAIATPAEVEAIKQLGLVGKVAVTGLAVPSMIRSYIKEGSLKEAALWNPVDIGYAAAYITKAEVDGTLDPKKGFIDAGRLGKLKFISDDTILLGDPVVFNKDNIDKYQF